MKPFEIPDSDDSDGPGFAASQDSIRGEEPEGDELVPDAMRSGSTDPEFFQTVYEEHREAVRQVSRSTKAQSQAAVAALDDPYDIPSSPEMEIRKVKLKAKSSSLGRGRDDMSYQPESKRRRVEEDIDDNISLVKVPSPIDDGACWSRNKAEPPTTLDSDLPSTLDPLQVTYERPQSQVLSTMSSGFVPTQDQGPSGAGRGGLLTIKSSGSATNANTPRSLPLSMPLDSNNYLNNPDPTQEGSGLPGLTETQAWPGSSPDLLASSVAPRHSKRGRGKQSKVQQMSPVVEDGQPEDFAHSHIAEQSGYASPEETVPKESVPRKPTKGKKQRGRPRKKTGSEPELKPEPVSISKAADILEGVPETMDCKPMEVSAKYPAAAESPGEPSGMLQPQEQETPRAAGQKAEKKPPKKKRGRPKKAGKQVPETDVELVEDAAPRADASDKAEQHLQEQQEEQEQIIRSPEESGNDATREAGAIEGDAPVLTNKKEDDVHKTATTVSSVFESKKVPPPPRGNGPPSASKPLYRVGLSKRSKIAPLLKIVRKD